MGRKLDLSAYQKAFYEVTMFDGEVLHIGKPTQGILIELQAMSDKVKALGADDVVEGMDIANEMVIAILNNNKEGKEYTLDYVVKNFDYELTQVFIEGYMEFVKEVQSNPN